MNKQYVRDDHLQIRCARDFDPIGIRVYICRGGENWLNRQTGQFEKVDEYVSPPSAGTFQADMAQQLMDDLYACGLRPSEGAGSAGAMAAVQAHLRDLQKLVFEEPQKRL